MRRVKKDVAVPPAPPAYWSLPGELVAIPVPRSRRLLDGFHRPYPGATALGVFVHGMGSSFYRSPLKKAFLALAREHGMGFLSFDNAGAGRGTEDERFRDCLADLDAVRAFARAAGYAKLVLVGHSTGCQKIAFWQSMRRAPEVAGLVLLAPADDFACQRAAFGRRFAATVARARKAVAEGRGAETFPCGYERFSFRRFLSVADPRREEAGMFRYDGPLTRFRRIKTPMFAVFGECEEFAPLPPEEMLSRLARATASRDWCDWLVPGAGHSFEGAESEVARAVLEWAKEAVDAD
jgi:pimeloyl-ACP methyl ester carboxylesterase